MHFHLWSFSHYSDANPSKFLTLVIWHTAHCDTPRNSNSIKFVAPNLSYNGSLSYNKVSRDWIITTDPRVTWFGDASSYMPDSRAAEADLGGYHRFAARKDRQFWDNTTSRAMGMDDSLKTLEITGFDGRYRGQWAPFHRTRRMRGDFLPAHSEGHLLEDVFQQRVA